MRGNNMQAFAKRVFCSADTKSERITILSNSLKAYSERDTERYVKDLMGLNFLEVMQSLLKARSGVACRSVEYLSTVSSTLWVQPYRAN